MKLYLIFSKKGLAVILALTVLALIIIGQFSSVNKGYADGATHRERMEFLSYCKISVNENAVAVKQTRLPQNPLGYFNEYNKILQKGDFDLTNFCGKEVTVYSYTLTESPEKTANLIILNGKIIAGDITDNLNQTVAPILKE